MNTEKRDKLADFLMVIDREYWQEIDRKDAPHIKHKYREFVAERILDHLEEKNG